MPALRPPVTLILRWLLSVGVLVAVALVLRGRFADVAETGVPWPSPAALLMTVAAFLAANEVLVRAWLLLVAIGHGHLDRALGRWVWAKSQVARYAVGMAQVASRALVARQHGLKPSTGALTTLLEVVWFACITGTMALATVGWWLEGTGLGWAAWFAVLPGIVIALAVVAPRAFIDGAAFASRLPGLNRVGKLARAKDLDVAHHETATLTLLFITAAVLRLAGFVALYAGVGGELSVDTVLRVTGAFALGHLIGAVAVFAPGGLGPREGVTAVVLAPILGGGPVLMLVGATRLLELLSELLYGGFARVVHGYPGTDPVGNLSYHDMQQ